MFKELEAEASAVHAAHNAPYDKQILENHGAPKRRWLCSLRLARHLLPHAPGHSNQVLRYWLQLDVPEAKGQAVHRALADAYITAALLRYLLMLDHGCETVEELMDFADSPCELSRVNFGKHRGKPLDEVPSDYLEWMLRQDFDGDIAYTARRQLDKRA